jgi:hypothetical protein
MLGIRSLEGSGGILAIRFSTGETIGEPQDRGNTVLARHSAYAVRSDRGVDANGRDKQRIAGSAAKDLYDSGATIDAYKRSLGDANDRDGPPQGLIQMRSETWPLERGQPYIAVDHDRGGQQREQTKHGHKAGQLATKKAARFVRLYGVDVDNVRCPRRFGFP